MIKTAIVGYGFSSKTFHIPFLMAHPNFEWTHVISRHPDALLQDFPSIHCLESIEHLANSPVDLVVITTPNTLHFEQAKFCLEHGMHVVLEKPMVVSSQQALTLTELSEKTDKRLCVFQNRRWDGDFLTLRSIVNNQDIGQIKRFTSRFDRFRPMVRERWREQPGAGTGMLWDLGPHLVDQTITLFGPPKTISARVATLRDHALVDDHFDLWLDYDDCQVHLGSSSFQAGPNARFVLEGTHGTFIKYGLDGQEGDLKRGLDVSDANWGHDAVTSWGTLYTENNHRLVPTEPGNYLQFWHKVSQCIEQNAPPPVPLADAVLVIRILELAHRAALSGQRLPYTATDE